MHLPLPIPVLFLLSSVLGALFTMNALWPARRFGPAQGPAFFASWLTGELVSHHLFWQILATSLFVWAGALHEWPGQVAIIVVGISWLGMIRILIQSRQANEVMERSLREAFGDQYERWIPEEFRKDIDERWRLRQRLFPLPIYDDRVTLTKNIIFSEAGGVRLRLDVYRPKGLSKNAKRPTILFIHGGAWMIGSKDDQGKPLAYRMAAHGWVVVSANYRLSPRFAWPDHIIDVKSAIRWIREHGAEYGADPDFIVITGGSAGGHLSSLAALTPNDPAFQPGFEHVDTSVQACVPFYGAYDFTDHYGHWKHSLLVPILERLIVKKRLKEHREVFEYASPIHHVRADAPPFFVIHGDKDSLAPVEGGRTFTELLRKKGASTVLYAELPGAQHAFEVFPSERTGHVLAGVEKFVGVIYGQWKSKGKEPAALSPQGERLVVPDRVEAIS